MADSLLTVADVLLMTGVLDNEQDFSEGGSDESRGITAINMAIDYFESVAASLPRILSRRGDTTIKTTANQESSPLPLNLLRVDRLWAIDSSTGLPVVPLDSIRDTGGHAPGLPWPLNYVLTPGPGRPRAYYQDSDSLYWQPIPDQVYEVRAYGLWSVPTLRDRKDPWPFVESTALPIAAFAEKYLMLGVDDPVSDIQQQAVEAFTPVLRMLKMRDRTGQTPRAYKYLHTT